MMELTFNKNNGTVSTLNGTKSDPNTIKVPTKHSAFSLPKSLGWEFKRRSISRLDSNVINPFQHNKSIQGVGCRAAAHPPPPTANPTKPKFKKQRFCRYYDIKSFT
jgi:hypothetical protein